uniref:Uncharacterized protein n=1 Tax=Latrodectus hesperus TaxID=256737 RepID=E7D1S1_LATHE|nr:hypothetical protein [Latrodectus hesperus]
MYLSISLILLISPFITCESEEDTSRGEICLPKCKENVCPLYVCGEDFRAVYVGCNCCKTCVTALKKGEKCDYDIEPEPEGPQGPEGPRVTTNEPICDKGLRCHPVSERCVKDNRNKDDKC